MATTTNFGWTTPDNTDLVKDGALAIRTLGSAIDTSLLDLKGGTTGQNLRKNSNTDLDFTWAGDATNTVVDAEGDLLVGDAADTLQRLALGTNGQILTVDTTVDGKIKWATPAASTSGLTFIAKATVTNSGTTSINNCFTSTYDHYRVLVDLQSHTNTNFGIYMRLRASSTDTTTNYESLEFDRAWSAGTFATQNTTGFGSDILFIGFQSTSSSPFAAVYDVMNPQKATVTQIGGSFMASGLGGSLFGRHTGSTQFDGLTILTSSGTWTSGNIRVYGYQNS